LSRLLVYVEGPSDRAAMEALLSPLLGELRQRGVLVNFFTEESGDRKKALLLKVPDKAVNILRSQPRALVAVMPDLYPKNRGFPHETFADLEAGIRQNFRSAMQRKKINNPGDLERRFHVFCFKHDLEALILASYESLKSRLSAPGLPRTWSLPVENVNHDRPPKRIVEELFASHGQRYRDTVDAPLILGASSYHRVAEDCPQCFKPFVELLASL
jgi:hypothetical protein